MPLKPLAVLNATPLSPSAELSKAQKQFNKLVKKIDAQRLELQEWQSTLPTYQKKFTTEMQPLLSEYDQQRIVLVKTLDQAYSAKGFSKTDREKLSYLISEMISSIREVDNDPELEAIYNKYNPDSMEEIDPEFEAEMRNGMQAVIEELIGAPLEEEIDFSDPEALMQYLNRKEQEHEQRAAMADQARAAKRKKSTKQLAKEAQQEQEDKDISLSIREVYRKLASALHPDRELDLTERARKTALMQRVNVAYEKKDLLQLLKLQLEVEQIDQSSISSLSDAKLKHYNKILTEQSRELEMEIDGFAMHFHPIGNFSLQKKIAPSTILSELKRGISNARHDINSLKDDIRLFADPKQIKLMLKTYRIPKDNMWDGDIFDDFC